MLLPGIEIGEEAFVGAGAVGLEDVPPRTVVVGNPARQIGRSRRRAVAATRGFGGMGSPPGCDDRSEARTQGAFVRKSYGRD